MRTWHESSLPDVDRWPCLELNMGNHVVRIWRTSLLTTNGGWVYRIDNGSIHFVKGNRGTVKRVAFAALMRRNGSDENVDSIPPNSEDEDK